MLSNDDLNFISIRKLNSILCSKYKNGGLKNIDVFQKLSVYKAIG